MRIASHTVAVVTGAANGIGRAIALELSRRNVRVALTDTDRAGVEALALTVAHATAHACDVRSQEAVQAASEAIFANHGRINLLVNCAGVSVAGSVEQLAIADFELAMETNFWGLVYSCRSFLPFLRAEREQGREAAICNVLSAFSLCALATKAAYAASKHAARALTEALCDELAGTGIRVVAIYPGATATHFVLRGRAADENQREIEARFLALGMRPEVTAKKTVRAIEQNKTRVLIGNDVRIVDIAVRLAPRAFYSAVRIFRRYAARSASRD